MKYCSVAEIAKKWNISERAVRNYCAQGRIPDTFLTGKTWNIPENAEKPSRIDAAIWLEHDALLLQQNTLHGEGGRRSACVIDHAVAGVIAIERGLAEHFSHKACVFAASDQVGNLTVGSDAAFGDFADDGEDFVDKPVIQYGVHGTSRIA